MINKKITETEFEVTVSYIFQVASIILEDEGYLKVSSNKIAFLLAINELIIEMFEGREMTLKKDYQEISDFVKAGIKAHIKASMEELVQ